MKRFIVICVLALAMLLSFTVCADEAEISFLQENTKVTITGEISPSFRSENVTLVITKKGIDIAEDSFEKPEAKDKIELVADTATDNTGGWKVVWYPSKVGHYTVKATINSTGASMEKEYYFVEESRKEKIEKALLSGTVVELEEVFKDTVTLSVLEYSDEDIAKIKDTSKVGRALYYIREDLEQASSIKDYIELAMQMAEFNEKVTGFEEMTTIMKEYGTIENLEFYDKISVTDVKNQVPFYAAEGILECGLNGYDDLFTESIVLAGVYKSSNYSFLGKYLDLLENKDYDDAEKDIKEKIQLALVGKDYDMQTLKEVIADIAANENKDDDDDDVIHRGSGGGGGGYSTGMSKVDSFLPTVTKEFSDVPQSYWAFAAINNLRDRKIIDGFTDNSYRPESPLTRAEAVTLLCRSFNIEALNEETVFADIEQNDWFAPYINAAYNEGFVSGDGTYFNPDENITRQDLCVMLYRFAQGSIVNGNSSFADAYDIADYAADAVAALSTAKIINGFEDNTFRPQEKATRAQMAQILYKYLLTSGM